MGGVISRVFGSRKEDSKSDVHEPKHRKRWSFRAARRNDEHHVSVPTRSSTMPARAHHQAQNVNAQFENTQVQQRTETEFEEIDEATVANRVQEILREVADDDDGTPVQVEKPVLTEKGPKRAETEEVRRTVDLVKPVAVAEVISQALRPNEVANDRQENRELQSHSVEATAVASENHSSWGETKDQAPKVEDVDALWQGQVQAKISEESNLLDLVKNASANANATEENVIIPEVPKHDEPVGDEEPKMEEVEALIQEQSHTENAQEPSLFDLVAEVSADHNVAKPSSADDENLVKDEHKTEENENVMHTESDLHVPESVDQSVIEHSPASEIISAPEEHEELTESIEEKPTKIEEIESKVKESAELMGEEEPNLLNFVNEAHADPVTVDETSTENVGHNIMTEGVEEQITKVDEVGSATPEALAGEPIKIEEYNALVHSALGSSEKLPEHETSEHEIQEEATGENHGELGQDTHIQNASTEETFEENLKSEADSQSNPEQEHAMDEVKEGEHVEHRDTEAPSANTEHLEDNDSEFKSEHQVTEPTVGDFVTDILTEAKHEVETAMAVEPEQQNLIEMNNQETQQEHEAEQLPSQSDGDEVAPTNVDNDFIEQLVSSVSNPEEDKTLPQSEEFLQDNVDIADENSGKIHEKAMNINGDESVISNDQLTGSVSNGYQE